jgi:hypothetical protein
MASGNGSSGSPGAGEVIRIHISIPFELLVLVDAHQIGARLGSRNESIRRLLETHPVLTAMAERLYDKGSTGR